MTLLIIKSSFGIELRLVLPFVEPHNQYSVEGETFLNQVSLQPMHFKISGIIYKY